MAGTALRRSSVKLKSLSAGYPDLNMILSQIKDTRQIAKSFVSAQESIFNDILKWSANETNKAIKDVASQLVALNTLWCDAQRQLCDSLKEYQQAFKKVLETEKELSQAQIRVNTCEKQEIAIKKQLKKMTNSRRATAEDLHNLNAKLVEAERLKHLSKVELVERENETEMTKLIQFRKGLLQLSESYVELGSKCAIVFTSQRDMSLHIPECRTCEYNSFRATHTLVQEAKLKISEYRNPRPAEQNRVVPSSPPPPYNPEFTPVRRTLSLPRRRTRRNHSTQESASHEHNLLEQVQCQSCCQCQRNSIHQYFTRNRRHPCDSNLENSHYCHSTGM